MKHHCFVSLILIFFVCTINLDYALSQTTDVDEQEKMTTSNGMDWSSTTTMDTPIYGPEDYPGNLSVEIVALIQNCERNLDLMDLCMRCAIISKNNIVYPNCCGRVDNVDTWCRAYVYYRAHKTN